MDKIVTYGNPVLRSKALPVSNIDGALKRLADAMLDLMRVKNGVGLAAQQVGQTLSIFVMHVPAQYDLDKPGGERLNPGIKTPLVLINPVLGGRRGAHTQQEGCLSFPGIFSPVHRAFEIEVSFVDLQGNERKIEARGLMARVIQHEFDHLNGVLFVDRIPAIRKIALAASLRKLRRASS
ncbi:MAG: peptide deformylase [Kiritimatiellia bacterium]